MKGGAPSEYSSLQDSQFLFGSQTWPENSQSFSQEISGQSRGSQQTSQEINETKVSSIYHSKPVLFIDSKVPNNTGGRALGILDRFEEEKRRAKETEILLGIRQLHESLENIQKTFLNCIDGSCEITRAAVAEGMDNFRKTVEAVVWEALQSLVSSFVYITVQDNFTTIKESIAKQTELLMSQMYREMKDNEAKTSLALKDLNSLILNLQRDLESVKLERSKEQSLLGEIMSLLGTIKTVYPSGAQLDHDRMIDNTVQTSPGLVSQFCVVSEEKRDYEGMKLCGESITYSKKGKEQSICPIKKPLEKLGREVSFQMRNTQPFQKQPHTETIRSNPNSRQKSYHLHSIANRPPSPSATSTVTALLPDAKKSYMVGGRVPVEPVKSSNDTNRIKSATWIEVPREKRVLRRDQRCPTIRKKKRALILPQRRPNQWTLLNKRLEETQHDKDQENRVPQSGVSAYQKPSSGVSDNHLPLQQRSTTQLMNIRVCEQHVDPWSLSQSSNSSQVIVEHQQAEWKTAKPEQNSNTVQRPRVTWQLFDFISDSD
ncbi:Interactor of HORMAD1 protein 1 [Bagarius yarrelli]|uniref:Interactor of HORMAD1 protein 1 n=1 Tax=Bagarius yarrelli TaxID=175774 RepID=A0A556VY58_BAGYA|nr:Interactor of HORMAD1 protein 1 [Bagarius yarrelli]